MAFDEFSAPSPTALFSEAFFSSLTFEQALDLNYLTIAPIHFVSSWSFSSEVQLSGAATLILPHEVVPCMASIQPILSAMQGAYAKGMRSVKMSHPSAHGVTSSHYHFSKVRLFKSINYHADHVSGAKNLINHFQAYPALIPPEFLQALKNLRICSSVKGFYTSTFPLYRLQDFLGENWLQEDLVNALSELLYFRSHADTNSSGVPPTFLFLPT
ncbi:hypothetical protein CPB84DRAFT_1692189, partial [Gymnopilus junonius]